MYHNDISLEKIVESAKALNPQENEVLLFLFGEESKVDFGNLIDQLNEHQLPFIGGVFPGIIYKEANYTTGYLIKKLPVLQAPVLITGLNGDKFSFPDWEETIDGFDGKPTILTFVDGLTSNIAGYLNDLYHTVGNTVNFLGGGAGSLTLVQKPCIFNKDGIFQDVAIQCLLDMEASLGVQHGWSQLHGPIVATRTEKNVIHELNWEKAFDIYKEVIKSDAGLEIRQDNFFDIAKSYPFGIFKDNGEDLVRDPIAVNDDGSLICVGEVPENTVLYILKGENKSLIDSAKKAAKECLDAARKSIEHTFIVDCISRTLFLEKEFPKELNAINTFIPATSEEAIPQGVLSLGEISSNGDGFLEFYNKTLVVGALYN